MIPTFRRTCSTRIGTFAVRLLVAFLVLGALCQPALAAGQSEQGESRPSLAVGSGTDQHFRLFSSPPPFEGRAEEAGRPSLSVGGLAGLAYGAYQLDAVTGPEGLPLGFGAGYGDEMGWNTDYLVRLGTGLGAEGMNAGSGSRFSLNPVTNAGLAEGIGNDVGLSLSLTHSITPNMSVTGMAGASRPVGATGVGLDDGQLRFGAGLGLKF